MYIDIVYYIQFKIKLKINLTNISYKGKLIKKIYNILLKISIFLYFIKAKKK